MEQTFSVICLATNNRWVGTSCVTTPHLYSVWCVCVCSGHSMRLKMVLDRVAGGGVVWSGVSGKVSHTH